MAGAWPVGAGAGQPPAPVQAPVAVAEEAPDVFVFGGHGSEQLLPYESWPIVPPGVTLVLFSECGAKTYIRDEFEDVIRDPSYLPILQNPTLHKGEIERYTNMKPHIYRTGDRYPHLLWFPKSEYSGHSEYRLLGPSGLHQLPMNSDSSDEWDYYTDTQLAHNDLDITVPQTSYMRYFKVLPVAENFSDEAIIDSFGESLYPTREIIQQQYSVDPVGTMQALDDYPFPLSDLVSIVKPGVYYWKICRHSSESGRIQDPFSGRRLSSRLMKKDIIQRESSRPGGRRRRRKTYRRRLRKNHTRKNVHRF